MRTGLFILISISVWEDENDEWWFWSNRIHKSESYGGCILLISSYFIRSTNHCHPHDTWRPPHFSLCTRTHFLGYHECMKRKSKWLGPRQTKRTKHIPGREWEEQVAGQQTLWNYPTCPLHIMQLGPAEGKRMPCLSFWISTKLFFSTVATEGILEKCILPDGEKAKIH